MLRILIAVYGAYAFVAREFPECLNISPCFHFFDFSASRLYFILDHLSVTALIAGIAYQL